MAGLNNIEVEKTSWLKWQIALAVGAPVAVGVGYWYLTRKGKIDPPAEIESKSSELLLNNEPKSKETATSPLETKEKAPLTGGIVEQKVHIEETPLERALSLKTFGNDFFKKKQYKDAIRCYTEAIDMCPSNEKQNLSIFYQNRAAAYEQMENFQGVIKDCSASLELDPRYIKALQRRGKAYEKVGEIMHCLEDVTATCIVEGFQNPNTLYTADRILQEIGKQHAKEAMKNRKPVLLSKHFVKMYFNSFTSDPVINYQKNEINGHGDEEELKGLVKARKALLNGDFDSVIPACNEELERHPNSYDTLLLRATMYFLFGEHEKALDDFQEILKPHETPVDKAIQVNALIKRASIHLQREAPAINPVERQTPHTKPQIILPAKCMNDFTAAEQLDPKNADTYHHRGQVYILFDKLEDAIKDFQKALEINNNLPIVQVQKLFAEYRLASGVGDASGMINSINSFKEVMQKYPKCIEAYTLYIQLCSDREDYAQADEYFNKAIKTDPENATLRVQQATLHLQWKADLPKAIEIIEEAIQIDDRCEYGYETLGTIEVQRGNLKRAVELFDRALLLAKTEREMAHIYSLRDAAEAQDIVAQRLGLPAVLKSS